MKNYDRVRPLLKKNHIMTVRSLFFKEMNSIITMSRYWNKILIDKLFADNKETRVKYKLNTKIGRFYFYFRREENSMVSGKLVFFPDVNSHNIKKT